MKKSFLASLFVFVALAAAAQSANLLNKLKADYPEDAAVVLKRNKEVELYLERDSLKARANIEETVLFLKDQANASSYWRVYGSYFQQIKDLKASVSMFENNRYKKLDVKVPDKMQEGSNFYDDSYFYPLSFPASAGNQADWSYREEYKDPRFIYPFYFFSGVPIAHSMLTIKTPKGVDISWIAMNDDDHRIQFKKNIKGSIAIYQWTIENYRIPNYDANAPKGNYYLPHILYYIKSYADSKKQKRNVLSDLGDLYTAYATNFTALDEPPSRALDSLVKRLVKPGDTELETVRNVFYWVQDHVRYIAFEDGMHGIVPRKPNFVLEKRYGDCKDMACLIVGMLRVAGIKSYPTLIGTRDLPYRYTVTPMPVVNNHMIATYIDDKKNYYFLDATGNYTQLGFPSSMIQGKEALIGLDSKSYEVKAVPELAAEKNVRSDSARLTISERSLKGSGKMSLIGYPKIDASYKLDKALESRLKDNVVDQTTKGNNKYLLDSFELSGVYDREAPLRIDYKFQVKDYLNYVQDELYINLNLSKVYNNDLMSAARKAPYESDYRSVLQTTYVLEIPEGYEVNYLPLPVTGGNEFLSFEMKYSVQKNTVVFRSKVMNNVLLLMPAHFGAWNEAIQALSKAYKESIVLKKIKK